MSSFDNMNYIIYLRKSRADNPDMSIADVLAKHEEQLQGFVKSEYGECIPESHIYREVVSGETIADRPVMRQLMKLLETGEVAGVIVIEPQRLSRGDLEDCGRIVNTFRYTNTLVITPPKTYNLSDEYDRKFFEMELTRGNDYLEYTKKILSRGRIRSVKAGNFIGSIAPYGYKKIKVGSGADAYHTLEIIPEEADALRLMYYLFVNKDFGFAKIAHHLDNAGIKPRKSAFWSPAAIKDMLENPVYIGKIRWNWRKTVRTMQDGAIVKSRPKSSKDNWIYSEGKHEPIIDEPTFQKALAKRGKNPPLQKNKEIVNPFAGILYCGNCERAMSYKRYVNKRSSRKSTYEILLCGNQSNCHTKSVQYQEFHDAVCDSLRSAIQEFEVALKNDDSMDEYALRDAQIKQLQTDIKKLRQKDARQKDAFDDGIYSKEQYLARNAKVQEQLEQKKLALFQASSQLPERINYQERILRLSDCLDALQDDSIPAAEKNKYLKSCISRIIYYNDMESRPGIGRYVKNVFRLEVALNL